MLAMLQNIREISITSRGRERVVENDAQVCRSQIMKGLTGHGEGFVVHF